MLDESRKEQLLAFCRKLVQAQSYSGQEGRVAEEIKTFCNANGYHDVHVDRYGNCTSRAAVPAPVSCLTGTWTRFRFRTPPHGPMTPSAPK